MSAPYRGGTRPGSRTFGRVEGLLNGLAAAGSSLRVVYLEGMRLGGSASAPGRRRAGPAAVGARRH
jgi:hypothetical protein